MRKIDRISYYNRLKNFDYDMIIANFPSSSSPGNEQKYFWGSKAANTKGSNNLIGIKSPAVDKIIDYIIKAKTRKELITATRVLDRVLTYNYYVIPNWYSPYYKVAYSSKIKRPKITPTHTLGVWTWWIDK